ncbi:MAG: SDR family NAD(P)-dependent oxidoreductase, partial [Myxococcales bacterium]|nr:SDR family NAD(P)-dependent oxidoreductase [Myxococcales bacterium]
YNAAKFAVRGYTEAVAIEMEVRNHPVQVHCVHPGGIRTNICRSARVKRANRRDALVRAFDEMARTTPEQAAAIILRGVDRGKRRIFVGPDAHLIDLTTRMLGSHYQKLVAWAARRSEERVETFAAEMGADEGDTPPAETSVAKGATTR